MDGGKNINITISSGTIFKAIIIILSVVLLFYVKDLVLVVLTSIVLASSVEPLTRWLKKFRVSRVPAVIIIYLSLGLMASGILYFFIPPFVQDTAGFLKSVPKYIDTISLWNPLNTQEVATSKATAVAVSEGLTQGVRVVRDFSETFSIKEVFEELANTFANVSEGVLKVLSIVFGGILGFILIIVLSFYFAVQEDGIGNFLRVIIPNKYEGYAVDLWKRTEIKIGYWLQGQLLLGVLVGVLVYLSLVVLGIQHALFLAVLAAMFEIIPLFGPILSAIPGIAMAYADGGMPKAIIVLCCYTLIQQFENHLFYPLVVKKIIGVPPILVILSLIVGGKLAGFLGLLLSVPVAAIFVEVFNDLQKNKFAKSN